MTLLLPTRNENQEHACRFIQCFIYLFIFTFMVVVVVVVVVFVSLVCKREVDRG